MGLLVAYIIIRYKFTAISSLHYAKALARVIDLCLHVLQNRTGAMKLKGGECNPAVPHGVPKECHYGIVLKCPDPTNKRL